VVKHRLSPFKPETRNGSISDSSRLTRLLTRQLDSRWLLAAPVSNSPATQSSPPQPTRQPTSLHLRPPRRTEKLRIKAPAPTAHTNPAANPIPVSPDASRITIRCTVSRCAPTAIRTHVAQRTEGRKYPGERAGPWAGRHPDSGTSSRRGREAAVRIPYPEGKDRSS